MKTVKALVLAGVASMFAGGAFAQDATPPGEKPVDPYTQSPANAGAAPLSDPATFQAFHGKEGLARIASDLVDRSIADPRIREIFATTDVPRLKRTLTEQFCYVLGGGCVYTGRDMAAVHKDMGVANKDFNALVENLQWAMDKEGVPFSIQNKLLAKLAPMQRKVVER
jgi:hemoglobin